MDLEKRIRMAAESILENEALREGLDDEAASALLDWGMARAKKIAAETADVEDDEEADEAAYPRMRGLRKILSAAIGLCAENLEPAQQTELLQEIAEQVPLVYGPATTFEASKWDNLSMKQLGSPAQIINHLRASIEDGAPDVPAKALTAHRPNVPLGDTSQEEKDQKEPETKKKRSFFDWFSKD